MPMSRNATVAPKPRLVIIGPADAAAAAERALDRLENPPETLGFVLLDGSRGAGSLSSLPVLGAVEDLPKLHARFGFDLALVSIPLDARAALDGVRSHLHRLGVCERFLPTIEDVLSGAAASATTGRAATFGPARAVDMLALVGRTPHAIDEPAIRRLLKGKRALITGAGGSIGSELATIVASMGPSSLALMDRSENSLFEIDRRIAARFPTLDRQAILHDVVESEPTLRRLVAVRPQVVFHAAAHKHVPMMEDHPAHAVNNNLFGTKSVADAALAVGVERFVMVSTDKAVNPTSVMGATKWLAELYIRSLGARNPASRFSLVRFGNVLGSACSVLPIWEKQIGEGGPVTVTDPRMTRFFMTIPEAAALVLQAAALERDQVGGADVFVLDMGEPVRIVELARRFVQAHGLSPVLPGEQPEQGGAGPRMPVVFTGARPGEKLHEELAHRGEPLRPTPAPGVLAWAGPPVDPKLVTEMVADLSAVRTSSADRAVLEAVGRWVPGAGSRGVHPAARSGAA